MSDDVLSLLNKTDLGRRQALQALGLGGGGLLIGSSLLAGCGDDDAEPAATATKQPTKQPDEEPDQQPGDEANNPLGLEAGLAVEGVFFEGGFGFDYIENAKAIFERLHPDNPITIESTQDVSAAIRPRFIAGNPPDVVDNSGAGAIDAAALLADGELADLTDLWNTASLDTAGKTLGETIFPGSQALGFQDDGSLRVLQIAYTVHGIWYSQALFDQQGWTYPGTWEQMLNFCDDIASQGFTPWAYGGTNAGHYMVRGLMYPLMFKIGGREVIDGIMSAADGAWLRPEVLDAANFVHQLPANGWVLDGAEALLHTEAQTEWVLGNAVFYPVGSWIENEMRDITPDGFDMVMSPIPGPDASTFDSVLAGGSEQYIVPTNAANTIGGKEFLRCMVSKENAGFFAENVGAIMPVIGGNEGVDLSPAVDSAIGVLEQAGGNVFPLDLPFGEVWDGWKALIPELMTLRITPEQFVEEMEAISVAARENAEG